jgi:hypothetical protein
MYFAGHLVVGLSAVGTFIPCSSPFSLYIVFVISEIFESRLFAFNFKSFPIVAVCEAKLSSKQTKWNGYMQSKADFLTVKLIRSERGAPRGSFGTLEQIILPICNSGRPKKVLGNFRQHTPQCHPCHWNFFSTCFHWYFTEMQEN